MTQGQTVTLHLRTSEGKPYTHESRKCTHCGLGLAYRDQEFRKQHAWTADPAVYANPPGLYVACKGQAA